MDIDQISVDNTDRELAYQPLQKLDKEASNTIVTDKQQETILTPSGGGDEWVDDGFGNSEDDDTDTNINIVSRLIVLIQNTIRSVYTAVQKVTKGHFVALVCLLGYVAYFITAMCYKFDDEGSHRLLVCTVFGVVIKIRHKIYAACGIISRKLYGASKLSSKDRNRLYKIRFFARWLSYGGLAAVIVWKLIDEGREKPENLRSLPGLLLFILIPVLFSTRPSRINWHTVYWSNGLQFLCAFIVLKWKLGREMVLWVQERFDNYFGNSKEASIVLFGPNYTDHQLVFNSFPLLLFSGATLATLYYLGVMQFIINAIGSFFKFVLNTSRIESSTVSLGIFTEGVTTLMTIRPLLVTLTKSEMFTVITCCFTSLGGAYVAVLTTFGVSLEFILPAMIVSAPACFAISKIIFPETKKKDDSSENEDTKDIFIQEKKRYSSIFDAFQAGALGAIVVVVNAVVVSFVFICAITWLNSALTWFGDRVGVENLSIELISSYVLYPVSLAMGVETLDCRRVALLTGYRIGFNNIIAFLKMAEMKGNKYQFMQYMMATNGTGSVSNDGMDIRLDLWNTVLRNGFLTDRSEAIVTYCLCGFSSIMNVGITMSIVCVMVPERKQWLSKITFPALIVANIANCMTGCFANGGLSETDNHPPHNFHDYIRV